MSKQTTLVPSGGAFSAPSPMRGIPLQLSVDMQGKIVAYASGKSAVARSIANDSNPGCGDEALKGFVYKHTSNVTCVKLSPRGNMCISGDESGNIVIWGLLPDKNIKYKCDGLLGGPIRDAAWSADQERMVVCADARGQSAAVFSVDGGNTIGQVGAHARPITTVDFRPARPFRVFSGAQDTQVNLHEGPPFKFVKGFTAGLTNNVTCVRFNPSGDLVACASGASAVPLLDGKTADAVGEIKTEHKGTVMSVDWAPAPSADQAAAAPLKVVTASADKSVHVYASGGDGAWAKAWETSLGKDVGQMQYGARWIAGGAKVLTCALDGTLTFLAGDSGAVLSQLRGHSRPILSIDTLDGSGRVFATADTAGKVTAWTLDPSTGAIVSLDALPDHKVETFNAFSAGSGGCLAFGGGKLFKADASLKAPLDKGADSAPVVFAARYNETLVVAASKQALFVLDASTGAQKATFDLKSLGFGDAGCIACDGASGQIAVAGGMAIALLKYDGNAAITKVADLKGEASPHRAAVSALAFSGSGRFLASGDSGRTIGVWDIEKRQCIHDDLVFHNGRINALVFGNDDGTLASGAGDGNVIIWNLAEKSRKIASDVHFGGVQAIAKVGSFIVSGGFSGNIMTWVL